MIFHRNQNNKYEFASVSNDSFVCLPVVFVALIVLSAVGLLQFYPSQTQPHQRIHLLEALNVDLPEKDLKKKIK